MTDIDPAFNPKPLRRPGVARRAAVLKAAAEVFLRQGYERASMSEIIALAGGSKAFLYDQFGDKAGLFRAVMREQCQTVLDPIEARIASGRPPRAVLTDLGRGFLSSLWQEGSLSLLRIVYAEGPRHPDITDSFFAQYDDAFERLAEYLGTMAPTAISKAKRCQLAMMFFCMVLGDALDRKLAGALRQRSAQELDEQIAQGVEWLLGQVAA